MEMRFVSLEGIMDNFNKKTFQVFTKITTVIVNIGFFVIMILLGVILLADIVLLFIPADILILDASVFEQLTVRIMNVEFEVPNELIAIEASVKWLVIFGLIAAIIGLAFVGFVFYLLRSILKDVRAEKPFSDDNVSNLYNLSLTFLLGSVIIPAAFFFVGWRFIEVFSIEEATVSYMIDLNWLFIGLLLGVLTGIFHYGSHLRKQVDSQS